MKSTCANCGHHLGLVRQRWWGHVFCCPACKRQFAARWWRTFRKEWLWFVGLG